MAAGTLLIPNALTIGFARRFATYKRADLLFRDPERLHGILRDPHRPVQVLFAGKAHPADEPAKHLLQRVYGFARDPAFEGRLSFVEDYEMHLAHRMVQSVDLWLNVPRVPMEACGTSGMKAALNGVPQVGTMDGWWADSVQAGRANLGSLEVAYPEYPHDEARAATAFIRPHELEILRERNGRQSLEAKVVHLNPARPVVKVRVYSHTFGLALTVDVPWDRYADLRLQVGDTVHVAPRQVRLFVQEFDI